MIDEIVTASEMITPMVEVVTDYTPYLIDISDSLKTLEFGLGVFIAIFLLYIFYRFMFGRV